MMKAATDQEHVLLRLFMATGMRKSEIAHLERSDLNGITNIITVRCKPKFDNWEPKTTNSERPILISTELMADLLAKPEQGLLFPNPETGNPEKHLERVIEKIAARAGVTPTPGNADPCHRWRDVYATWMMKFTKLRDRDIARNLGHAVASDLGTLALYAEFNQLDSPEALEAAKIMDPHANDRKGPVLVRKVG
jgi:integrase